jgi:hypothetical protein
LPSGGWNMTWMKVPSEKAAATEVQPYDIILATGHHLEWLLMLPEELQPSGDVYERAAPALARANCDELVMMGLGVKRTSAHWFTVYVRFG